MSLNPEGPEVVGDLETRYHGGTHPLGDGLGVADMITMRVGEDDMRRRYLGRSDWGDAATGEERIDENLVPPERHTHRPNVRGK